MDNVNEPPKDGETNKDAGSGVRAVGPTQQGITASGCPSKDGLANLEAGSQSGPASPLPAQDGEVAALIAGARKWLAEWPYQDGAYTLISRLTDALARLSAPVT